MTKSINKAGLYDNKGLARLIIPLVVEQFLIMGVGMIDTVMVSICGEAQVSAVSLVDMINALIICLFAALATGGCVVVSQFLGAGKKDEARKSAKQLCVVTLLISAGIMIFCLCANKYIIKLFFGSIEKDVFEYCVTYFRITALSFPFLALYNCAAALFRAMGKSSVTMKVSFFSNIVNVAGNYYLINVLKKGVAGAAAATTFARFASMLLILFLLTNKNNEVYLKIAEKFSFDKEIVKRILFIGVPNGVETSIFELGRVLVVSIISTFGTVQITANAVANTMDGLGCVMGRAIGLAMLAVIGHFVGMGDYDVVKVYIKKLMKIAFIAGGAWNFLIVATLPLTIKLFNLSPETQSLAMLLIFIHDGFAIFMWPIAFCFPNALRAANDVKFAMVLSIASMFVFRITLSIILGKYMQMGAVGVWIGMCVDWIARSIGFILRYKSGKWMVYKN